LGRNTARPHEIGLALSQTETELDYASEPTDTVSHNGDTPQSIANRFKNEAVIKFISDYTTSTDKVTFN